MKQHFPTLLAPAILLAALTGCGDDNSSPAGPSVTIGSPVIVSPEAGSETSDDEPILVVSKVANFAVDLPAASVAIQISGTFGSRQEEAQRLGRILRPKPGANKAWFYTLVTRDTVEVEYARRRQIFLAEQGYSYEIEGAIQD